jgi:hypothetical protein
MLRNICRKPSEVQQIVNYKINCCKLVNLVSDFQLLMQNMEKHERKVGIYMCALANLVLIQCV